MTITKKVLFFLGAVFFLTCSSTYIKVQAAQDMPDKSVQIGKKTTMQVKDSTLSTQNKAALRSYSAAFAIPARADDCGRNTCGISRGCNS